VSVSTTGIFPKRGALYGKTISRVFYPTSNGGEPLQIPVQTLQYFLFANGRPSIEDAEDGTGSVSSGTQVAQSATAPFQVSYTYPAYSDPNPEEIGDNEELLWESILYRNQLSEQIQVAIRSFKIARTVGMDQIIGTDITAVKEVFPSISNYMTDTEIADFIENAELDLKNRLRAKGIRYERVLDLREFKLAIAYKAIADASSVSIVQPNDKHAQRWAMFEDKYKDQLQLVVFAYDADQDGEADSRHVAKSKISMMYVSK
jgi:hypothetical protein